jgi:hypothetical protein
MSENPEKLPIGAGLTDGLIWLNRHVSSDDGGLAPAVYYMKGEKNGHCCQIPHRCCDP